MFLIPGNLYRVYIGLGGQLLSQWSGGPSITIYAVNLFAILGVTGSNESLFATAIFGVVKLVSANYLCTIPGGHRRSKTIALDRYSFAVNLDDLRCRLFDGNPEHRRQTVQTNPL